MKSKTYVLSDETQKIVAKEAIHTSFKNVIFEELCEQNSADRSYFKYCAEDIYPKYARLDTDELARLIEFKAISILEDMLWGHRFEAIVFINSTDITDCCNIYVSLSVLREG